MLEKAGIDYIINNENARTVDGYFGVGPSNMAIEIKVLEENSIQAVEIYKSIV